MSDLINHPNHYNNGKIEAIDVIEDWKLNFSLGCVVKYICRSEYKDANIQDLEKARWYLSREIERRKKLKDTAKTMLQNDPEVYKNT